MDEALARVGVGSRNTLKKQGNCLPPNGQVVVIVACPVLSGASRHIVTGQASC
jgi:hypothetical protein